MENTKFLYAPTYAPIRTGTVFSISNILYSSRIHLLQLMNKYWYIIVN